MSGGNRRKKEFFVFKQLEELNPIESNEDGNQQNGFFEEQNTTSTEHGEDSTQEKLSLFLQKLEALKNYSGAGNGYDSLFHGGIFSKPEKDIFSEDVINDSEVVPFFRVRTKTYATTIKTFIGKDNKSYIALGHIGEIYIIHFPSGRIKKHFRGKEQLWRVLEECMDIFPNTKVRSFVYFQNVDTLVFHSETGGWGRVYKIQNLLSEDPKIQYICRGDRLEKVPNDHQRNRLMFTKWGDLRKTNFSIHIIELLDSGGEELFKTIKVYETENNLTSHQNPFDCFSKFQQPRCYAFSEKYFPTMFFNVFNVDEIGILKPSTQKIQFIDNYFPEGRNVHDIKVHDGLKIVVLLSEETLKFFNFEGNRCLKQIDFEDNIDNPFCTFFNSHRDNNIFIRYNSGKVSKILLGSDQVVSISKDFSLADRKNSNPVDEGATVFVKNLSGQVCEYFAVGKGSHLCVYEIKGTGGGIIRTDLEKIDARERRMGLLRDEDLKKSKIQTFDCKFPNISIGIPKLLCLM